MKKKYLLGIDGGTGGMRVGIFDFKGYEKGFASVPYPTYYPHSGWAEQKPLDWWRALRKAIQEALQTSQVKKEEILALSYDVTCCSVVLSKNDGTVLRNSLIWMDVRATEEAHEIAQCDHPVLKFNGYGNVSAEWMPCKVLWLKRYEPKIYEQSEKICEYADWLTYQLTGKWTMNLSNSATRWYYDSQSGGIPDDFYQKIGLGDVLAKFPQRVTTLGEQLGKLRLEAAEFLGLTTDTIVGQGGADAFVGILGLGLNYPGEVALMTGSSHLVMGLTDQYTYQGQGVFGPFPDAIQPGLGFVEGGQTSSGSILTWFIKNFCRDLEQCSENPYDVLDQEARTIAPGSNGLLILDWWQGNRTPYTDPDVRGMIYGLSLASTRSEIYRAILEGVAYGTENVLERFRQLGFQVNELVMGGGTLRSDLWIQIHADVSNLPVKIPENGQAPTLGSAILASVAAGVYETNALAIESMVRYRKVVLPHSESHKRYQQLFKKYQLAYPICGEWMKSRGEDE